MSHTITYRINNHDLADPTRTVDVQATPEQISHLVEEGYLVRERLFTGERLEELRAAADELAAKQGAESAAGTTGNFGGLFIRNVVDRHPTFLKLIHCVPLLSVARAVLGPQVQIHGTVVRVTYPGQPKQETHWHFHQRVIPEPMPPFFARPRVLDNLIYLDDIDEATGPLCVVPRTHLDIHRELPAGDFSEKPGQMALCVPAGSCVTADAGLWHRAMPTRPDGRVRRLLIWGYSATWMKQIDRPGVGLTEALLKDGDRETKELLGYAGYY
jgi:ectoine hydroxylase-related dioxygenase (phytanoyl-CoA dioxygenase family)